MYRVNNVKEDMEHFNKILNIIIQSPQQTGMIELSWQCIYNRRCYSDEIKLLVSEAKAMML